MTELKPDWEKEFDEQFPFRYGDGNLPQRIKSFFRPYLSKEQNRPSELKPLEVEKLYDFIDANQFKGGMSLSDEGYILVYGKHLAKRICQTFGVPQVSEEEIEKVIREFIMFEYQDGEGNHMPVEFQDFVKDKPDFFNALSHAITEYRKTKGATNGKRS